MSKKANKQPAEISPAFAGVEDNCRFYASARNELRTVMQEMQTEVRAVGERFRDRMQAALDQAVNARGLLEITIKREAALFTAPKTRQFHGVKVGYRKLPGKVVFDDEARVIARVKDQLPELQPTLIDTQESIRKNAIVALDAKQLAAIGVSLVNVDDELVLKAADTNLDKLIKALSGDETMSEEMVTQAGAI